MRIRKTKKNKRFFELMKEALHFFGYGGGPPTDKDVKDYVEENGLDGAQEIIDAYYAESD